MNRQQSRQAARAAGKSKRDGSEKSARMPVVAGAETAREMNTAVRFHQAGNLQDAADIYRRVLERHPAHFDALHLSGLIHYQTGQNGMAVELIRQALVIDAQHPEANNNLGVALKKLARLDEAADSFQRALAVKPNYAEAHFNLGDLASEQGRIEEAIVCYQHAIAANPNYATAHFSLGNSLIGSGHTDAAIASYRQALHSNPNYSAAHYNLGVALLSLDRHGEAQGCLQRALAIDPNNAKAHSNLGVTFEVQGENEEAIRCFEKALAIDPGYAEAHQNLGAMLNVLGRADEAIACYQRAVAACPEHAELHYDLGCSVQKQNHLDAAKACFERAVEIKPDYTEAHGNLGVVLKELGDFGGALACYQHALAANPEHAETHYNLGCLLRVQDELDQAKACFERALSIDPDLVDAYVNLGSELEMQGQASQAISRYRRALSIDPTHLAAHNNVGTALEAQGRPDDALDCFRRALEIDPNFFKAHSNLVFSLNYSARTTPQEIFAESRRWDAVHAAPLAARARPHPNDSGPERRLRVGYVSPDFRNHAVSYFFEPLLAAHDRRAVEIFCYAEVAKPDQVTDRIRALADEWRSTVGLSDAEVADRIRKDRIDILVDMAGHTSGNRLLAFAERPAPVQVTWLGYGGTTGMSAMDYRLSDAIVDPRGEADSLHSETLIRLPDGFFCYTPPADAPEIVPPPSVENGHITFGSFNNVTKLRPGTIAAWCRVLERVPGARLMIKSKPLADEETRKRYLELFAAEGIGAERLDLVAWVPSQSGHLGAYGQIDIALDTYPCNGGTTTCEALWMGVPVVALRGDRFIARMGDTILSRVGLADLVTADTEGYVETAVALANDHGRLAALRATLRERMHASPLCDARGFAGNVETAYRDMWRTWCRDARDGPIEDRREAVGT